MSSSNVTAAPHRGPYLHRDRGDGVLIPGFVLYDQDGNVASLAGGTQYVEDSASANGDLLTLAGAVRRDTAASSAGTDGDYATINTDSTGRLWVNSELPDAAALADGASNPTTPMVGAALEVYNGTTWDRMRGASADALAGTGILASGLTGYNGTTWDRLRNWAGVTDGSAPPTGLGVTGLCLWDGTNAYRPRVGSATNFAMRVACWGVGGSAIDSTSSGSDGSTNSATTQTTTGRLSGYNGTTWDRLRTVNTGQLVVTAKDSNGVEVGLGVASGDGLATATLTHDGARLHGFNGTTWDRLRSDANKYLITSDGGSAYACSYGVANAVVSSADASGAAVSLTAAPTSGQKIVIDDIFFSSDTALRVDFREETSGTIVLSCYVPASSGMQQITPRGKIKLPTADKKLQMQTSVAGNVRCTAVVHSEA